MMIHTFLQKLYRQTAGFLFRKTGDSESNRRFAMLNSLSIVGAVYLIIMSLILAGERSFFYAGTNIFFSFLIIVFFILVNKSSYYRLFSTIIITLLQYYFIFLFHTGSGIQMAFIWYYLYPLISFFILGIYAGLALSINLIVFTVIINFFSNNISIFIHYPSPVMIRIIMSYTGVLFFTYIFEKNRLVIQKKLEKTLFELNELAIKDSLTGLYNRRYMNDMISRLIDQCRRSEMKLGFIMTDLDYFKNYNDTYGHLAGDKMLVKFSGIMQEIVKRKTDFVFRYGGEEFFIILSSTNMETLEDLTRSIIRETQNLSVPHRTSPYKIATVSAGAVFTENPSESTFEELINMTDKALYEAKSKGRNCYVFKSF